MIVIGIDPGLTGALALYASEHGLIEVADMPVLEVVINGKKRKRLDHPGLRDLIESWKAWGVEIVVLEDVAARPAQSGMFAFGFVQGAIVQLCTDLKLHVEQVTPSYWKKALRVGTGTDEIIQRADQFFPEDTKRWRGKQGGKQHDKAEAALLAKFGAMYFDKLLDPASQKRRRKEYGL